MDLKKSGSIYQETFLSLNETNYCKNTFSNFLKFYQHFRSFFWIKIQFIQTFQITLSTQTPYLFICYTFLTRLLIDRILTALNTLYSHLQM